MSQNHKFQVNLHGVIELLSHHLYSGPQVYLRELLQNSVDAIAARRLQEPGHAAKISLEVIESSEGRPTLVVRDNGIGLTEDEVHRFLATIGQSSKRESLSRDQFIGQFGIGLLSGFLVCEEIVVITQSVDRSEAAVEWRGREDGTYALRKLEHEFEPGTEVYLRAKEGFEEFFDQDYVQNRVRHYGSFLPFPIHVKTGTRDVPVNETPPWANTYPSAQARRDAYLEFGQDQLETDYFDAIPLKSVAGGIEGIAFVLPFSATLARKQSHRVYLKRMLLAEHVDNLLPEWAFFVQCVVNATDLRPTASREGFFEDERLEEARDALGKCLRDYLVTLAREDSDRLNRFIQLHHLAIKALALEDDEFYRLFIHWIPFETSLGMMTLGEFTEKHDVVRYARTCDQFRQISAIASAQSMGVINAGYAFDAELLERLPELVAGRKVIEIDAAELAQTFEELSLDERDEVFEFVKLADRVLQPYKCSVEVKKFQPNNTPALFAINEDGQFLRSIEQSKDIADPLWSGVLERIADAPASMAFTQLCLNFENDLIRRLVHLTDRQLIQRSLEMLYVQALLLGHYPLKAAEMRLLNTGLLGLIEHCVQLQSGENA